MRTYLVETEFVFSGVFEIKADSKEEAKNSVEEKCGLVLGGDIYSFLPINEADWEFDHHPQKRIKKIIKGKLRDL